MSRSLADQTNVVLFAEVVQARPNTFMRKVGLSTNKSNKHYTVYARSLWPYLSVRSLWTVKLESVVWWGWCDLGEGCFLALKGVKTFGRLWVSVF